MMNKNEMKELPREKLIKYGPDILTDSEILAIMLGSGSKDEDVLQLSNRLIKEYGLKRLLNMSYIDLSKIKGIKESKATKLMACFELAKRASKINHKRVNFKESVDIFNYVKPDFYYLTEESVKCLYLDVKLKLIAEEIYESDYEYQIAIPNKKIVSKAISLNAYGIVLIHNHPSGDLRPSSSDIESTIKLQDVLATLNIYLLDHLIVSKDNYISMLEEGIIIS